jgi:hypothetical protein
MLKLSDNPPPLSPPAATVADLAGRWWIAHTNSRSEKAFAWDLIAAGIGYYLPMATRTTISGGRKRHGLRPLFTSYVFVCGGEDCRYKALATGRLCAVLPVPDQARLVTELTAVQQALAGSPGGLDLYPFAAAGRRCRVTAGPFMGLEGIVVRRTQRATLVLEVSILRQGASLEVDLDVIEPIDPDE